MARSSRHTPASSFCWSPFFFVGDRSPWGGELPSRGRSAAGCRGGSSLLKAQAGRALLNDPRCTAPSGAARFPSSSASLSLIFKQG